MNKDSWPSPRLVEAPSQGSCVPFERRRDAVLEAALAAPTLAVLVIGIDRLPDITDALGPAAAAEVLAVTAARLGASRLRGAMLTQLPGDTFALTLASPASQDEVLRVAAELLVTASPPVTVEDEELLVSVSIGVALGAGALSGRATLRDAATAQHRAQQRGGGCIEVFTPELRTGLLEMLRLEGELRTAVASNAGLSLFFQPIVSLESGSVMAVESLMRWDHPTQGLLLPRRFVPVAERAGILPQIEQWVIREASQLLATGELPSRVSVNVSAAALNDPGFTSTVADCLRANSIDGAQLIVELGETALLGPGSATRVAELRALGVAVWLADFGASYASLAQLERLPIDGVKLGRPLLEEHSAGAITDVVQSIVGAARSLGLTVVATGVETQQQLERARELGANAAQGLYFLGPVPAHTLIDVLALGGGERKRYADAAASQSPDVAARGAGEERAVTLGQAAKLLGISASTLRRWTEDGRVGAVRTSGGHRRFYMSELARLSAPTRAQLRLPTTFDQPLPGVAELLYCDGADLATTAARALYEELPGWFGSQDARDATRTWIDELAAAFARGSYPPLIDSLRRYMLVAEVGGSTLTERHMFLERFGAALEAHLNRRDRPQREQTTARRTISALALQHLADADADHRAPPRVPARSHRERRGQHIQPARNQAA
ncbi:MAG: EAL domain-containing protein [Solirubrobacteraceae bacterium]